MAVEVLVKILVAELVPGLRKERFCNFYPAWESEDYHWNRNDGMHFVFFYNLELK